MKNPGSQQAVSQPGLDSQPAEPFVLASDKKCSSDIKAMVVDSGPG